MLYEMLTGHFFFESYLEKHKHNLSLKTLKNYVLDRKIHIKLKKKVDPFWHEILKNMLQKDYRKRKNMHEIELLFQNEVDRLKKKI